MLHRWRKDVHKAYTNNGVRYLSKSEDINLHALQEIEKEIYNTLDFMPLDEA